MRSLIVTTLLALSLAVSGIVYTSFADDQETDALRDQAATLANQAKSAEKAGQQEEATQLRKLAEELQRQLKEQLAGDRRPTAGQQFELELRELYKRIERLQNGNQSAEATQLQALARQAVHSLRQGKTEEARQLLARALSERRGPTGREHVERNRVVAEIRIREEHHEQQRQEREHREKERQERERQERERHERERHERERHERERQERERHERERHERERHERERHERERQEREHREELQERIEHMRVAAEHLHAAGLHDEAEHVSHRAEELQREHGHHVHDRDHDDLHHRVRDLSGHVRELHERLERIERLLHRLGEKRGAGRAAR